MIEKDLTYKLQTFTISSYNKNTFTLLFSFMKQHPLLYSNYFYKPFFVFSETKTNYTNIVYLRSKRKEQTLSLVNT